MQRHVEINLDGSIKSDTLDAVTLEEVQTAKIKAVKARAGGLIAEIEGRGRYRVERAEDAALLGDNQPRLDIAQARNTIRTKSNEIEAQLLLITDKVEAYEFDVNAAFAA